MARRMRGTSVQQGMPFQNDSIQLTAHGTLTPGNPLVISANEFQASNLRQPIEITELRMMFVMESATNSLDVGTLNFQPSPAAYVRVQARAGRFMMTQSQPLTSYYDPLNTTMPKSIGQGYVPVSVLCPRINAAAEYGLQPGNYVAGVSGGPSPMSYCVWKFDRPMALPLGVAPELTFLYASPGTPFTGSTSPSDLTPPINVFVQAVGRMIPEVGKIFVPYATSWSPVSAQQDTSENDFKNNTGQTVLFRKIVARAYQLLKSSAGSGFWGEVTRLDPDAANAIPNPALIDYSKTAQLQLFDEEQRGMMRTPMSFSSMFPEDTCSLPFFYNLKPGAHIDGSYSGLNVPTNVAGTSGTTWMPVYCLLGGREEVAY